MYGCTPISFIHLAIDGYLDYFQLLAIMNNATLSICVQVFVAYVLLNIYLGVDLLGHMVTLHLTF